MKPDSPTPCPSCQSMTPSHHFADCTAGVRMEITSNDREKYALKIDTTGEKTGKPGTKYWELIGIGGEEMKTDPGIHGTDEFTKAFGTPRDAELGEDIYLVVKIFVGIGVAAVLMGCGIELGRAVAKAVLGGL